MGHTNRGQSFAMVFAHTWLLKGPNAQGASCYQFGDRWATS